jgi:hypothetical protein
VLSLSHARLIVAKLDVPGQQLQPNGPANRRVADRFVTLVRAPSVRKFWIERASPEGRFRCVFPVPLLPVVVLFTASAIKRATSKNAGQNRKNRPGKLERMQQKRLRQRAFGLATADRRLTWLRMGVRNMGAASAE